MTHNVRNLLGGARVVFWDFDGVIKDSLEVKAAGFERLFASYGKLVAARVRAHHEANGGMSRFEKMPMYLGWAGEHVTPALVRQFCDRFGGLVRQAVVDAPWVTGVHEYLAANHETQHFVLVTATPQDEIQDILRALGIAFWFRSVHGAPQPKAMSIRLVLEQCRDSPNEALMIGDADADFEAAGANGISFILRRTPFNAGLQHRHSGPSFESL